MKTMVIENLPYSNKREAALNVHVISVRKPTRLVYAVSETAMPNVQVREQETLVSGVFLRLLILFTYHCYQTASIYPKRCVMGM